jgi:hypothetical protein
MKVRKFFILLFLATAFSAQAAEPVVYPANNQTPELQTTDQQECRQWAVKQAGYDPVLGVTGATPPPAPSGTNQQKDRAVLRTTAKGAAVGALGGSMGGETGEGAAVGAAVGAVAGLAQKRKADQAAQQQAASIAAKNAELEDKYYRAYGACLEARGYSVK